MLKQWYLNPEEKTKNFQENFQKKITYQTATIGRSWVHMIELFRIQCTPLYFIAITDSSNKKERKNDDLKLRMMLV